MTLKTGERWLAAAYTLGVASTMYLAAYSLFAW